MILISAQGLGRQYAGDPVFLDLAFEIRAGERIGLVGPNGAGKTTLMKLLDGIETPEYGHVHVRPGIRVSLLVQQPEFGPDETLMDVARSGLASLLDLQRELGFLNTRIDVAQQADLSLVKEAAQRLK